MLLNSVMIVSQEVFEVALLICLIVCVAFYCRVSFKWIVLGTLFGVFGAWLFAENLQTISILWEYRGQEIVVSIIYATLYISLVILLSKVVKYRLEGFKSDLQRPRLIINTLITVLVSFSLVREIGEVFVYNTTYLSINQSSDSILLGTLLGFGIGSSFAVILFFVFSQLKMDLQFRALLIWAGMTCGVLALKSGSLLSQAGFLPQGSPLWDTSNWLNEQSILGHLASALIGYDPQPTASQIISFAVGVVIYTIALSHARRSVI